MPVLIAAGVVAYFVSRPVGIVVVASAFVAMVWTGFISARRGRSGEPLGTGGALRVFVGSMSTALAVVLSSLIAFVATCFPISLIDWNQEGSEGWGATALVVGGIAAVLAGGGVAYLVGRNRRGPGGPKPLPEEEIR